MVVIGLEEYCDELLCISESSQLAFFKLGKVFLRKDTAE